MRQKDSVRLAEEVDQVGDDLFNGGLSPDHSVSDAVHPLDVRGNGYVRIDELFESGQLTAVQSKAHGPYFDQPMHNREETSGLSIESHKGDIGETWLSMIHEPSRPFPGDAFTYHRQGATVRYGGS